jgi:hypothetical protein
MTGPVSGSAFTCRYKFAPRSNFENRQARLTEELVVFAALRQEITPLAWMNSAKVLMRIVKAPVE